MGVSWVPVSTDMVRVGALRRISKSLLPHSLHAVDFKAKSDAVGELKDMLAGSTTVAEAALIQRELDQLKQVHVHDFFRAAHTLVLEARGAWGLETNVSDCNWVQRRRQVPDAVQICYSFA